VASAVVRRALAEGQSDACRDRDVEDLVSAAMWFPYYRQLRYEPAAAGAAAIPAGVA
jgi:hypothetical protein